MQAFRAIVVFVSPDHPSPADGFALAMLAMVLLSLSVIAMLAFCMRRNAARRDPHVDRLLDELDEEAGREKPAPSTGAVTRECQPWEKDPDWWKS